MGSFSFQFGANDIKNIQQAKLQLQESEDRALSIDKMETVDLAFHVEKEGQRTQVLIWRGRLQEQISAHQYNRTLIYLGIGFGLLMSKGIITFADIGSVIHFFFGH